MSNSQFQQVGDLEIEQDLNFQQRSWTVQRVAWGIMGLVLIAALLGIFGSGPLSHATARDPQIPLALTYSRFARYMAPDMLEVQIDPDVVRSDTIRIWFTTAYLNGVQLQYVTPQPERVEAGAERITYVFRLSDPSQPAVVFFHLQPQQIGPLSGQVGLESSPPLPFHQFIYP